MPNVTATVILGSLVSIVNAYLRGWKRASIHACVERTVDVDAPETHDSRGDRRGPRDITRGSLGVPTRMVLPARTFPVLQTILQR